MVSASAAMANPRSNAATMKKLKRSHIDFLVAIIISSFLVLNI
jgi:hypothetical protein